jgi:hypothetical protein
MSKLYDYDKLLETIADKHTVSGLIAGQIAPDVPVEGETGYILSFGEEVFTIESDETGAYSPSVEVEYSNSYISYALKEHRTKHFIPQKILKGSKAPNRPMEDVTMLLTGKRQIAFEKGLADSLADIAVVTNYINIPIGQRWDQPTLATSVPLDNIEDGKRAFVSASGDMPNVAVTSYAVWAKLKRHPQVIKEVTGNLTKRVTEEAFADYIGVEKLLVGYSVYNTANPGQPATLEDIWGKHFFLLYVTPNPSTMIPSFCYTLRREDYARYTVDSYENEDPRGTFVRLTDIVQAKVVSPKRAYAIRTVIS